MPQILLVDSQPTLREGLKHVLDKAIHNCTFGESGTGHGGLQLVSEKQWDIVIMQLALPDAAWMDLIRRFKAKAPQTPLLAFCRFFEDEYGPRCLALGAAGYLSKTAELDTVVDAVKQVLDKGVYVSPKLADKLGTQVSAPAVTHPHEGLSNREYQVFRLIVGGLTCTQIAQRLNLSVKTVSTHRKRVLEKMGMKSNADLIHYATSLGLAET
jgi:two-component system, NarL family, invasion response regulator UvrY